VEAASTRRRDEETSERASDRNICEPLAGANYSLFLQRVPSATTHRAALACRVSGAIIGCTGGDPGFDSKDAATDLSHDPIYGSQWLCVL
jgi:hypothetical protein